MIKFAFMINRAEGMSVEDFVEHHRRIHGPLFASIPEAGQYVRKYTVSHPVATEKYPAATYDGLTEIWFDNWETTTPSSRRRTTSRRSIPTRRRSST